MARARYVFDQKTHRLVPADEYYAEKYADVRRGAFPTPRIGSDNIEVKSMLDGKVYTSKGRLRETYRAAGVEEVGNEPLKRPATKGITAPGLKEDVARAVAKHT